MNKYEYRDTFAACGDHAQPDGWVVDRRTNRVHQHGRVEADAYRILCRGNRHRPLTPPLKDFALTFECRGDAGTSGAGIYVFLRYNPESGSGYYIKRRWGVADAETHWGVCERDADRLLEVRKDPGGSALPPLDAWNEIRVEVQGDTATVWHNGVKLAVFKDSGLRRAPAGSVAFDRDRPADGDFCIRNVHLCAAQVAKPVRIWKPCRIEFPAEHNGIVSPIRYHLEAVAYAGHCEITVRLSGGPAERHDPVLLPDPATASMRWQNEHLVNPYLRLERSGGGDLGTYFLFRCTVGLKTKWDRRATGLPPADTDYPVERIIRLPLPPPDVNVFIGYEYYEAEERQWMKGGPTEAWIEPGLNTVLQSGMRLAPGGLDLEIESAPDKALMRRIPANEPRRAQALSFARTNHYFLERERIRFWIRLRHRLADTDPGELAADWTLEDVFRQPIAQATPCRLRACRDNDSCQMRKRLGVLALTSNMLQPGRLPVGVYHLVARLRRNGCLLAETRRAFEVLSPDPAVPSPPQASGLPELMLYEASDFHSAADVFDPWTGRHVDEGHYVSHNGFPAGFAKTHRAWNLVRLYRRKWWCVVEGGNTEPEAVPEIVRQADVLYPRTLLRRFDLWLPHTYRKHPGSKKAESGALDALLEFIEHPDSPARGDTRLDAENIRYAGELSQDGFHVLTTQYWKPWLEFFNHWYARVYMPRLHKRLRALNPDCEWGWFGPYPPYGSVYKSAWFPHLMGRDLRSGWTRTINGPMRFESYPIVCGYPIQRDVFQLASMKMEAPSLRLYPEVYGMTGIPADQHVMLGSPPYARAYPPSACYRKRFFEYAYAAVWFNGKEFRFWDDNGFQPKHWGRAEFSEFLSAWSVIRRVRPRRPLRTTGFVYSRKACQQKPDSIEHYAARYYQDGKGPIFWGDIFNTAEESLAFAYEQARLDGQLAGFIVDMAKLEKLSPENVHTLVLPPLIGLNEAEINIIREAHAKGVNLLGFEDVTGMEDIFGVKPVGAASAIRKLRISRDFARKTPWSQFADANETVRSDQCVSSYANYKAKVVIEGLDEAGKMIAPVLTTRRTRWGSVALFTIPPTLVHREAGDATISYGKASLSRLMNHACAHIQRWLGTPPVETTAGKLIGFHDTDGKIRIIIAEDSHPEPARKIEPVVTIRLPRLNRKSFKCDKPFEIVSVKASEIKIRLSLKPDECAMLTSTEELPV